MNDVNLPKTESAFKNIYVPPFWTGDGLEKDRDLVRKLKDIRDRHIGRVFKIYRGDVAGQPPRQTPDPQNEQ